MKIIVNNYRKESPVELAEKEYLAVCEECNSEFTVTKDEVTYGHFGLPKTTCPCCGRETYIAVNDLELTLTAENLVYPDHYYHFNGKDASKISNSDVNEWVRKLIKYLEENISREYASSSCGDTYVCVYRVDSEKEYQIIVSKGYAETYIPYK